VRVKYPKTSGDHMTRALIEENVLLQLQHLRTHPGVAAGIAAGTVRLHGWIYNIGNGRVLCFDEEAQEFAPIEQVLGIDTPKSKITEHPGRVGAPDPSVKTGS
jgi:carbonic anhydrase